MRPVLPRRAGAVALVIAALAAGRAITSLFPPDDDLAAPYLRAGTVGRTVPLRYADVTATAPQGSPCVARGVGDTAGNVSPGVFVVVPLRIVARGEPALLGHAAIVAADGRTYLSSVGSRSSFGGGGASQPGVVRYSTAVIELPADAVPGARLRVALDALDQRRDDMADIDLRLTAADASRWAANRETIAVPDASDLPPTPAAPSSLRCEPAP